MYTCCLFLFCLVSSLTSDQPSLLSSNSSGSLGGIDTTDEGGTSTNMNTSSEVTSGGQVFVVKTQSSMDSADGNTNTGKNNSPQVPLARKKNGDIRASLTEEVLVNELNSHQNGGILCLCIMYIVVKLVNYYR